MKSRLLELIGRRSTGPTVRPFAPGRYATVATLVVVVIAILVVKVLNHLY